MKILVMSRDEIEKKYLSFSIPTAIISIRCFNDKTIPKIELTDFISKILFLRFDDLEATDRYKTFMSYKDAEAISDFVESIKDEVEQIIVQCDAGISRSAGVAAAIGKYLNDDDMFIFGCPRYAPNKTCYRRTLNALMGIEADESLFDFNTEIFTASFDITTEKEFNQLFFKSRENFDIWRERKREEGFL